MNYPITLVQLENSLALSIPDSGSVKSTYEQLLEKNPLTPFPFWAKLWASSKALTSFLINHSELIQDKSVLEIGAGIGQPSFTIAAKAKEVIISDHNADAVELINYNIQQLGCTNVKAACLDWNDFPENIQADIILLSDINYAPDEFEPLLKLIQHFIKQKSKIIIATPQRIMASPFIEKLEGYIKHSHATTINEADLAVAICVYILME